MSYSAAMSARTHEPPPPYHPVRLARQQFVAVRGWRYHVHVWGDARLVRPGRPPLVLLHGWMDVGASFQFLVDALHAAEGRLGHDRFIIAPDWRGYGLTEWSKADSYWSLDLVADLDAILDTAPPDWQPLITQLRDLWNLAGLRTDFTPMMQLHDTTFHPEVRRDSALQREPPTLVFTMDVPGIFAEQAMLTLRSYLHAALLKEFSKHKCFDYQVFKFDLPPELTQIM